MVVLHCHITLLCTQHLYNFFLIRRKMSLLARTGAICLTLSNSNLHSCISIVIYNTGNRSYLLTPDLHHCQYPHWFFPYYLVIQYSLCTQMTCFLHFIPQTYGAPISVSWDVVLSFYQSITTDTTWPPFGIMYPYAAYSSNCSFGFTHIHFYTLTLYSSLPLMKLLNSTACPGPIIVKH